MEGDGSGSGIPLRMDVTLTEPHDPGPAYIRGWDTRFILLADLVSRWSKDPSTKVGAVLVGADNQVLSVGFNGLPIGVDETDPERWERPLKYEMVAHAERNCLDLCDARPVGARLYLNWEPHPCVECAKACIQNGVEVIVGPDRPFGGDDEWGFDVTRTMLREAGVQVRTVHAFDNDLLYDQRDDDRRGD